MITASVAEDRPAPETFRVIAEDCLGLASVGRLLRMIVVFVAEDRRVPETYRAHRGRLTA
jgi:hypothetical protein